MPEVESDTSARVRTAQQHMKCTAWASLQAQTLTSPWPLDGSGNSPSTWWCTGKGSKRKQCGRSACHLWAGAMPAHITALHSTAWRSMAAQFYAALEADASCFKQSALSHLPACCRPQRPACWCRPDGREWVIADGRRGELAKDTHREEARIRGTTKSAWASRRPAGATAAGTA